MFSIISKILRRPHKIPSSKVTEHISITYPWEVIEMRKQITEEYLASDPEIAHEIERLKVLASVSISNSPDWFLELANKHSPLRAIVAIHEAGHTFPYLSIYPNGGKAYATLSDNPKSEKSLCYPDSPKAYTIENLWWNICAKMAGPAAEQIAIGQQFDDHTWTYDYTMCDSIQHEYSRQGVTIKNLQTGDVDFRAQRSVAFNMMQFIFLSKLPLLTSIADSFCEHDRIPLRKIISEKHPQGISINLQYPQGQ